MITHDLGVVADMADRVLVMYAGRAVEYGTVDEVFYRPLHPYTWGLMDSIPAHGMTEKTELCPIKGSPPSLINVPSGCAFHPRCPYAQAHLHAPRFRLSGSSRARTPRRATSRVTRASSARSSRARG